ncbi:hypothetical protein HIM_00854 [Hirsutella minnesotensis 3608]|nr:hypothetical protein HIM_00854 [Hirsutella minnesotensis 3608]
MLLTRSATSLGLLAVAVLGVGSVAAPADGAAPTAADPLQELIEGFAEPPKPAPIPEDDNSPCLTGPPSAALLAAGRELKASPESPLRRATREPINIDLYMHIIAASDTSRENLKDDVIKAQVDEINRNFQPAAISFTLRDAKRIINADWAKWTYQEISAGTAKNQKSASAEMTQKEREMSAQLRKGGFGTLNVYTMDLGGVGGRASLPTAMGELKPNSLLNDGILLHAGTLPGAGDFYLKEMGMNQGKALTHEIGHWLGLMHTFDGGCVDDFDQVGDTPASSDQTHGCPTGKTDTCPTLPGDDPIDNFMAYTNDQCRTKFTDGQIERMRKFWKQYREPIQDCGVQTSTEEECGTFAFCQLYDFNNVPHDKKFASSKDCVEAKLKDVFCFNYERPAGQSELDCQKARMPEVQCVQYDFPNPPDKNFPDRAACLEVTAKSCDAYNSPQKPDDAFKDSRECLASQAPSKFCALYNTNPRPDNRFQNSADCLAAQLPYTGCMFYNAKLSKLRPDNQFKDSLECSESRQNFAAIPTSKPVKAPASAGGVSPPKPPAKPPKQPAAPPKQGGGGQSGTNAGGSNPFGSNAGGSNPFGSNAGGSNPFGSNAGGSNPFGSNAGGSNPQGSH